MSIFWQIKSSAADILLAKINSSVDTRKGRKSRVKTGTGNFEDFSKYNTFQDITAKNHPKMNMHDNFHFTAKENYLRVMANIKMAGN